MLHPFAKWTIWMDLEIFTLASKSERETNVIHYHYMVDLIYDPDKLIYETETAS